MSAFNEIGLILVIAALVALVMQSLRLPLILGHILTGILVGPLVFNLIHSSNTLAVFSQLGITALLFIVGLNLTPRVMREVGKASLVTGLVQAAILFTVGYGIALYFGFPGFEPVFIGLAVTFTSTIIALKFLSDKKDLEKLYGKIAVGTLLVQDVLATVVLLSLSAWQVGSWSWAGALFGLSKILAMIFVLWLFSMYVLPRLTRFFAGSQEFLFLFAVGWGLGVAMLFNFAGWSLEIGALAAGVILASSPYHYEISAKMKLLRDFFITLFFVVLGSQVMFKVGGSSYLPLITLVGIISLLNPIVIIIILTRLGYAKKTAFLTGITLSQMSEFSFLLLIIGARYCLISPSTLSLVTLAGLVSMVVSTVLFYNADRLYDLLAPVLSWLERSRPIRESRKCERFEVLLLGCHRVGSDFLLSLEKSGRPYLVVDFDPQVVAELRRKHIPSRYGDVEDNEFIDELCLTNVAMIICTVPELETELFVLEKAHQDNPDAIVICVAQSVDEALALYEAGAAYVIMPHYLGGNYASLMLEKFGFSAAKFREERERHVEHLQGRKSVVPRRIKR